MRTVLHIGEYVQGGVATYLKTLVLTDVDDGIENHLLISYDRSEHQWSLPANRIHYYRYKRNYKGVVGAMLAIHRKIVDIQPDIIYCHSTWAGVFVRFPYLFMNKKIPIIYNAHGWAFLRDAAEWKRCIYACVERLLSHVTDKIINVSKYEYDNAVYYGVSKEIMCVIYSGLSDKKESINHAIHMDKDKINILFVGRFDPQKGIDILLETIKKCKRSDVHIYVIGDNVVSDGMGIKKQNTNTVTFMGWMAHGKVAEYYAACDVVIMPSRWEAFGLVAIEAMKYSKPVIVSNRGALPEIINNGEDGFIFDLNTQEELSALLMKLNKDKLAEMGVRANNKFHKKFTRTKMMDETLMVINSLVDSKGNDNEER